jgi:hypothetical protein
MIGIENTTSCKPAVRLLEGNQTKIYSFDPGNATLFSLTLADWRGIFIDYLASVCPPSFL